MKAEFGQAYRAYKSRTGMFLPLLGRGRATPLPAPRRG
jgi:hypothetical protein